MSKKKYKNKDWNKKLEMTQTQLKVQQKEEKKIQEENKIEIEEVSIEDALSRVKKNEELYNKENLSLTKQQKFNFEESSLEDEMDNSFLDKKTLRNKKTVDTEIKIEEIPLNLENKHKKYPVKTVAFLILVIIVLSGFLTYHYVTFNHNKVKTKIKKEMPETIVFLGDSITNGYKITDHFKSFTKDYNLINSGINGNTTEDILSNLRNRVYQYNPSKIFILIGTNDIGRGKNKDDIYENIEEIVKEIKEYNSKIKIYIESIYPVDEEQSSAGARKNEVIKEVNEKVKLFCDENDITYIDCYDELLDEEELLNDEYTYDGLHLTEKGYDVITDKLKEYII